MKTTDTSTPAHLDEERDPDYIYDKDYAKETEKGRSFPRWMDPFSKVNMFGEPTVFSPRFMK